GSVPPPLTPGGGCRIALLEVEGRQARILAETEAEPLDDDPVPFTLEHDDGAVRVRVGDALVLEAVDATPRPPGSVGVWAYDCGADGDPPDLGDTCVVHEVRVFAFDEDDDGVPDDRDNCEAIPNEA